MFFSASAINQKKKKKKKKKLHPTSYLEQKH